MTSSFDELIEYRISRAWEALEEAEILAKTNHWNACINRLYYACFYAVNALLIKNNLSSAKHSGVRALLNREFVNKGIISKELATTYNDLFEYRKESDYEDFYKTNPETVAPLIEKTKLFINFLQNLIK